ncbi:MAG TPA: response regulator [Ruminiclostridium sp.]
MNMDYYNIIIVEDEEDIRNGLANVVDWESIGFVISEVFSDGDTALEYLKSNDVDVIISDIVMPRQSGLDIAKWVQENKPKIRVVLLSGYSDFAYAQRAIKYNVKNYFLKPTNIDEIYEVFCLIRIDLEKQTFENRNRREKNKKQEKVLMLFRQMMFSKLLSEGIPEENTLTNILEISGFKESAVKYSWWFCTLCRRVPAETSDLKLSCLSQKNVDRLFSVLNGDSDIFSSVPVHFHAESIDLIIWSEIKNDCKDDYIEKYITPRMLTVKNLLGYDLEMVKVSYFSNLKDLFNDNKRSYWSNISEPDKIKDNYFYGKDKFGQPLPIIKDAINRNDVDMILDGMSTIIESDLKDKFSLLQKYAVTFIFELRIFFINNVLEIPILYNDESVYKKIILSDSTDIIIAYCMQVLEEYKRHIVMIGKPHVRKIKEYIEEHILEEINTADIAQLVYLNPTYLSRMFKKETGENITEYITRHKMEKAKELLTDHRYKVYQIGEMIGYKDVRHFYKIFKKTFGHTPNDYRNKA